MWQGGRGEIYLIKNAQRVSPFSVSLLLSMSAGGIREELTNPISSDYREVYYWVCWSRVLGTVGVTRKHREFDLLIPIINGYYTHTHTHTRTRTGGRCVFYLHVVEKVILLSPTISMISLSQSLASEISVLGCWCLLLVVSSTCWCLAEKSTGAPLSETQLTIRKTGENGRLLSIN